MNARRAWFLVHPQGLVVRRGGAGAELPTEDEGAALALGETYDLGPLGTGTRGESGRAGVAVAVAKDVVLPPGFEIAGLRELFGALDEPRFVMAGRAIQTIEWADTHRFCGRCATATESVPGERCKRCPACGLLGYPRISPAVIVLVRRGDEALLAQGARFPAVFYSTLAGFVEIGESLEQTIVREIREEVGIEVTGIRYFGSQPWPFPHSLMVGFFAEWASGEIRADGHEILDAKWFRADALPSIPPPVSIARHLIDAWLDDVRANARA